MINIDIALLILASVLYYLYYKITSPGLSTLFEISKRKGQNILLLQTVIH